jgi:hypothetical protein
MLPSAVQPDADPLEGVTWVADFYDGTANPEAIADADLGIGEALHFKTAPQCPPPRSLGGAVNLGHDPTVNGRREVDLDGTETRARSPLSQLRQGATAQRIFDHPLALRSLRQRQLGLSVR